jgi:hypothetical protein
MIISQYDRQTIILHRKGHETLIGAVFVLKICWWKFIREIRREFLKAGV